MDSEFTLELKDFFTYIDVNKDDKICKEDIESLFQSLGLEDDEIDLRDVSLPLQFPLLLSMFDGKSLLKKGLKTKEILRLLHNIDDPKNRLTWSSLKDVLNLTENDWKIFYEKFSHNSAESDLIDVEILSDSLEWKHF